MSSDESGSSSDSPQQAVVQALVWLAKLVLELTSEKGRVTLARVSSHSVVLTLTLITVALSGLDMPTHINKPQLEGGQSRILGFALVSPAAVKAQLSQVTPQAANMALTNTTHVNTSTPTNLRPVLITQPDTLTRQALPFTQIPDRPRAAIVTYTVQSGDTLFGIALQYGLAPETVLWANPDLNDNPDMMDVGMTLNVPPVDGVIHLVQTGDSIASLADKYKVSADAIINAEWNSLRPGQSLNVDHYLIIPGGKRELVVWQLPTQKSQAVSAASSGAPAARIGFCEDITPAALGTGTFVWPEGRNTVGGNPYASWHRAIDISGNTGDPVYASDSGTVVYAGWNTWGYGNLIVLDHGNGWQTWYAHLSRIYVACGQQVYQGAGIGAIGSTGRSTGPHLHFETRHNGDLPNPLNVLP